ncbi:hypothetical protein T265_02381 [Opisthorchis viverrini]|uniref:Uncharacterized protein n=1 Tax=Opisthorchis viverrini TaxID=6198 RepID=A0A075A6Q1_OPIVI|nr:hypothetical protein T265_02381 [Opisthorchis viverrini]KER31325.1 hypothetical protein T265_02381 [Opisthorchis viverrini]
MGPKVQTVIDTIQAQYRYLYGQSDLAAPVYAPIYQLPPPMRGHLPKSSTDEIVAATTIVRQKNGKPILTTPLNMVDADRATEKRRGIVDIRKRGSTEAIAVNEKRANS